MRLRQDQASISVPATTEGLGPVGDCLALALDLVDDAHVRAIAGQTRVSLGGTRTVESFDPTRRVLRGDEAESHLTIRAVRFVLDQVGAPQAGIELRYHQRIPQRVGLGASTAATMAGLTAARALLGSPPSLDFAALRSFASELGVPASRFAAASLGGLVLLVQPDQAGGGPPDVLNLPVTDRLDPVALIPGHGLTPETARTVTPASVSFKRARSNAGRSAALISLLSPGLTVPEGGATWQQLLVKASEDQVAEPHLNGLAPASGELVKWLRQQGIPAFISGFGPAVVALLPLPRPVAQAATRSGWQLIGAPVRAQGM